MKLGLLTFIVYSFLFNTLFAEDLDELLGGFDEEIEVEVTMTKDKKEEKSWLEFSGDYTFSTAYNYKDKAQIEGLSRLRSTLNLIFDIELSKRWKSKIEWKTLYDPIFSMREIEVYTQSLRTETELKEAYLQGSFKSFDIKVGRQITVWGKSDTIRITDVINPLDNREIGMVDIENLRLPVMTSKLSYFFGNWAFNVLAIYEARIQKEAEVGSEFFPSSMFPAGFSLPPAFNPESNKENIQYASSLDGSFSGWDLSFYSAKVLDQRWHLENNNSIRRYTPIKMNGMAINSVVGSWLFKTEVAFLEGLRYNTTRDDKKRLDILLGLDYSGITDLTISLELANRHIYDYEIQMFEAADFLREDEFQTALRSSYSFNHDTVSVNYLVSAFGKKFQDGGFQRFWLNDKFNDSVALTVGFIDYRGGAKPYFNAIATNDRLFFDFKYSF